MSVQRVGSGPGVDVKLPAVEFHSSCDVEATLPPGIPDVDERLACARVTCQKGREHDGKACLECAHYRGWREGPGPAHVTVHCDWSADALAGERMTPEPLVVGPELDCEEADALMRASGIRHLLVVAGDKLVGVLCRCDLYAAGAAAHVADRMSRDIFAIEPGTTLGEALSAFERLSIGCLPIVDGERLVGILTRGDLRRIAVPETLLGAKACVLCGSRHGVRAEPQCALDCCLDCIDMIESATNSRNLGEGD